MAITEEQIANGVKTLSSRGEPREKIAKFVRAARATQQQPQEQEQPQVEQQATQVAFSPELVAGTPEQQSAATARNLQGRMGWTDPVDPNAGLDIGARMMLRAAPTAAEKSAYLNTEFGEGNWTYAANDKFFVKVGDGKGGKKWVINDPKGFDVGDVAEFLPRVPEFISGFISAYAATPTPQAGVAKLAIASGASALASELTAAGVDALFRAQTGQPINVPEIVERRGKNVLIGTALGTGLMKGVQAIGNKMAASSAASSTWRTFMDEGKEAKAALKARGYNAPTEAGLAPQMLEKNVSTLTTSEAGDTIARVLNEFDERANAVATKALGAAGTNVEQRSAALLSSAAPATVKTQTEIGEAAVGAVKTHYTDSMKTAKRLYAAANQEIESASGGAGAAIIKLPKTDAMVRDLLGNRMLDANGKPIALGPAMIRTLTETLKSTSVPQKLDAVRTLRTQLGAQMNGEQLFPEMAATTAKRLYGALSDDMATSIVGYTGKGAKALKDADAFYKEMVLSVEANPFLNKVANGKFTDTADVVATLKTGGVNDWAALKKVMPANTYALVKRGVIDALIGGEEVFIAGKGYKDSITLGRQLGGLLPEVKNEIFGNPTIWRGLERIGKEQEFIAAKQGIFSRAGAISPDTLRQTADDMRAFGFDVANFNLRRALAIQMKRADSLHSSLVSQVRNGNFTEAAKDPVSLMDAFMSGKYSPEYVNGTLKKLPIKDREQVSRAAFARIFEKAIDSTTSLVNNSQGKIYQPSVVADSVLGSQQQRKVLAGILGNERYATAREWVAYTVQREKERARQGVFAKTAARIISVLPYGKLLLARFGSEVIETAAGKRVLNGISPQSAALFAESRMIADNPVKTAAGLVIMQRAAAYAGYEDYQELMSPYSMEQRNAIDAFLLGKND
jgi:hypothetical protein